MLNNFSSPAHLTEFGLIPNLAEAWSHYLDQVMQTEIRHLETGAVDTPLGPGASQFYNPLHQFQGVRVQNLDIAWTGFPRTLAIRFKRNLFPENRFAEAERFGVRPDLFTDNSRHPVGGLLQRQQDEYLEWRPEYNKKGQLIRVTFTCESPEYWSAFADGFPAPYFLPDDNDFDGSFPHDLLDPARRALFVGMYRQLTGNQARESDLFFDRDIYVTPSDDPRVRHLAFREGAYNPWNRWNTTDGIVHLTNYANTLGAEINLAARATIQRKASNRDVVTDVAELICRAGFGGPTRASDPTIGGKINERIRNGFSVTLADPVGLYIDSLDISGWTEPDGDGGYRPVGDYFTPLRFDATPGASRTLRALYEVPADRNFTLSDLRINGLPLRSAGQIAECITMKLTAQATFSVPNRVPLMPFISQGFHCKGDPDEVAAVSLTAQLGPDKSAELRLTFPCDGEFIAAYPPDTVLGAPVPAKEATEIEEPILDLDDIQGNVLSGFNKDFQNFLFFTVTDVAAAKAWLTNIHPGIATETAVHAFNQRYSQWLRSDNGKEEEPTAEWVNIAFSLPGLRKFIPPTLGSDASMGFRDAAFVLGLPERAAGLGDAPNPRWEVGGRENIPDFLLLVAADREDDLAALTKKLLAGVTGAELIHADEGRVRQDARDVTPEESQAGRDHFGFKDGISQPGIRGRIKNTKALFTPRRMPKGHPRENEFSRPGQPLVFPGQFVFGCPTQSDIPYLPGPLADAGPEWAKNGSFLVYRRLNQDVEAFWREMDRMAGELSEAGTPTTATAMAAKLIGRWPSGAPVLRSPAADNPAMGMDADANNNFDFVDNRFAVPDNFQPAQNDLTGNVCPFAAHIRKANPRDDATDIGGVGATLRRRILRRGLIFGPPADNPLGMTPEETKRERGLLFLCYQTSIVEQFEFLMSGWINHSLRPKTGGVDMVMGTNNRKGPRRASIPLTDKTAEVERQRDFITPTGGGYFFAPSLSALRDKIARQ